MKKIAKVFLIMIGLLLTITSVIAAYIYYVLPDAGNAPLVTVEKTPQRIERGKYLVNSVAACMACHAERDFRYFAGPVDSASFGAGGERFGRDLGFPGELYTKNITPHALQNWTDGELLRALTMGVRKDGKALFGMMPYKRYAHMNKEDVYSMIAYLRTLKPIKKDWPEKELDFPLNFIVNTMPGPAELHNNTDTNNAVQYGGYLVNVASCVECHTPKKKGETIPGMEFAGGRGFRLRTGGIAYSANITPDKETGIGNWTKEAFIQRFKMYEDTANQHIPVKAGDPNTPMPWATYGAMTTKDLAAIYDYLQTVTPVKNQRKPFLPAEKAGSVTRK